MRRVIITTMAGLLSICGMSPASEGQISPGTPWGVDRIAPAGNKTIIALGAGDTLTATKPDRTLISFGDAHLVGVGGTVFVGAGNVINGRPLSVGGKTSDDLIEITEAQLRQPATILFEAWFGHDVIEHPLTRRLRHESKAALFSTAFQGELLDTSSDSILLSEAGGFGGQDISRIFEKGTTLTNNALRNYVIDFGKLSLSDVTFIGVSTSVVSSQVNVEHEAYGLGYVRVRSTGDTLVLPEGLVGTGTRDAAGTIYRNIFLPDSFVFRFEDGRRVWRGREIVEILYENFSNPGTARFRVRFSIDGGLRASYSTITEAWLNTPEGGDVKAGPFEGPTALRHGPAPDEFLGALRKFDPVGK